MGEAASVLVRVWLPDRPGALGLVASRIGAVRGDIVGIDVLERGEGVVIDEFAVRLGDVELLSVLIHEVEEVDGASVEEVRIVGRFPDPRLDALESAAKLCESADTAALGERLVAQTRREFLAEWSALVAGGALLAVAGEAPPTTSSKPSRSARSRRRRSRMVPPDRSIWQSRRSSISVRSCSSVAPGRPSGSASGLSSWRSPASPTAPGSCSTASDRAATARRRR